MPTTIRKRAHSFNLTVALLLTPMYSRVLLGHPLEPTTCCKWMEKDEMIMIRTKRTIYSKGLQAQQAPKQILHAVCAQQTQQHQLPEHPTTLRNGKAGKDSLVSDKADSFVSLIRAASIKSKRAAKSGSCYAANLKYNP
eukprot:1139972-Pelagomonas_calceolata.AAC.1